ncbi:hypothetical protein EON65_42975 [archaeon]|nr:MAG: hypothetical protein EON65_42975 [archaeon]
MDSELLAAPQSSSSSGLKTKIDVPRSIFLSSVDDLKEEEVLADCHFDRLPRHLKEEYTERLAEIFASIPKLKGQKSAESNAKGWDIAKYSALADDLALKPDLEMTDVKLEQVRKQISCCDIFLCFVDA